MKSRNRTANGFTLLEILIAITILAVVLSMCYTILASTLNLRKWIQESTEVERVGNRLIEIMVMDLQSAYMYQIEDVSLMGGKTRHGGQINLVTNRDTLISSHDVESDLCEIGYYLEPNLAERDMFWLVRREDFFLDDNPLKGGNAIRLYDRVVDFQVCFYDARGSQVKEWDSKKQKGLPIAIEVTIGIPSVASGSAAQLIRENTRWFKAYIPILVSPEPPEMEKPEKPQEKDDPKKR